MNAPKELCDRLCRDSFERYAEGLEFLDGEVCLYPCCSKLQVADYSCYSMAGFVESTKKLAHERDFPKNLENAFQIGRRLAQVCAAQTGE